MVIETSPQNFQVWIHSANALSLNDKQYWQQKLCNDPGAHPNGRWGDALDFEIVKKFIEIPKINIHYAN